MLKLIPQWFIRYKFFNSLLLGLSVGAIFTIYTPLEPSVYSLGGVVLATGMLLVARLYTRILNAEWFFRISLFVEIVLLLVMCYFLLHPYTYQTALIVYIGYQATFVFGNYLVRVETLLLGEDRLLTRLDTAKQMGYLLGMAGAYLFYRLLDQMGVADNQSQVYYLHFLLITVEVLVILLIIKSFQKS
jgi:hypothetical protein